MGQTGPSFEGCASNWMPLICSVGGTALVAPLNFLQAAETWGVCGLLLVLRHVDSLYLRYQPHKNHSKRYIMIQQLLKKNLA